MDLQIRIKYIFSESTFSAQCRASISNLYDVIKHIFTRTPWRSILLVGGSQQYNPISLVSYSRSKTSSKLTTRVAHKTFMVQYCVTPASNEITIMFVLHKMASVLTFKFYRPIFTYACLVFAKNFLTFQFITFCYVLIEAEHKYYVLAGLYKILSFHSRYNRIILILVF